MNRVFLSFIIIYSAFTAVVTSQTTTSAPTMAATSGFSAQPTAGTITATGVTVSATPVAAVMTIICGVFADDAIAPTASEVAAGTGSGGAAVGGTNGPIVPVVTGTNGGAGTAITNMAVTGLTASTSYDIY